MTASCEVDALGIRVFIGYRQKSNPRSTLESFLLNLGQTFIPGTPYMLQPLGLVGYMAAVFAETEASPLPNEVALIIWRSQVAQRGATRDTLRGRVYTLSHGGVYDDTLTGATFPIELELYNCASKGAVFVFEGRTDWQAGSCHLLAARRSVGIEAGETFRRHVVEGIRKARPQLASSGIDQSIATLQDDFVLIWDHSNSQAPLFDWQVYLPMAQVEHALVAKRIMCREEPPTLDIDGSVFYNFIFDRSRSALST